MKAQRKTVHQILNYLDHVLRLNVLDSDSILYNEESSWICYVHNYIKELESKAEIVQEREVPQHILDYWMSQSDDVSSLQTAKIELQRKVEEHRIALEAKVSELALLTQLLNRDDDTNENSTSEATCKEVNYMERTFIKSLESLIQQKGRCHHIDCHECPFSARFSDGGGCCDNALLKSMDLDTDRAELFDMAKWLIQIFKEEV